MLTSSSPTAQGRAKLLQESESKFQKSDESAYSIDSIVPSRMSMSTSRRDSYRSIRSQDTIEYRPLTFEKNLFMSKVYLRSSKNVMLKELSKARISFKPKATAGARPRPTSTAQAVTDWEGIRDQLEADSLLATSCDVSINDNETIRSYNSSESRPPLSEEVSAVDVPSPTLVEEFILACKEGNTSNVEWLISRGIDLHTQSEEEEYSGLTAIHVAAMCGHVNIVHNLLVCGASIEELSRAKQRPLHVAALKGQVSMVDFLIRRGAQVDAQDTNGNQPIHEGAKSNSLGILNALTEAGATVDCSNQLGYQPLHYASMKQRYFPLISSLCKRGANIEAKTSDSSRPIHLAMKMERNDSSTNFSTLLACGAKMEYHDGTEPALNTAVRDLLELATEELLKHGADPNCQGHDGKTALHTLASIKCRSQQDSSKSSEIFRLLLDRGANLRMKDRDGNQMLHLIASQKNQELADMIAAEHLAELALIKGADTDGTNNHGLSPLFLAMKFGLLELSRLLIMFGARVLMRLDGFCADIITTHHGHVVRTQRFAPNSVQEWIDSEQRFQLTFEDKGYFTQPTLRMHPLCDALEEARDSHSVLRLQFECSHS